MSTSKNIKALQAALLAELTRQSEMAVHNSIYLDADRGDGKTVLVDGDLDLEALALAAFAGMESIQANSSPSEDSTGF